MLSGVEKVKNMRLMFSVQNKLARSMHLEPLDSNEENEFIRSVSAQAIPYKFGANVDSIRPLVKAMTLAGGLSQS